MLNAWNFGYNFTATNNVSPAIQSINQGMDQLGRNSQEEAAKVANSFFAIETAARVAAKGMATIHAMQDMKHDFADFQAGIAEASTLLVGASVDMQTYEDALLSMSKQYGELPADLTKSLYTAISSGFVSAQEAITVLDQSMKLAVGGVTSASEAMDGLTTILHAWGLTTADAARVSDTLFVGMRAGKTTIGELAREIGQVASFAYQAGVSLEEITASAAALTLGGRTTAEAMNGLRSILTEVMRQEPGVMKTVEELEKASGIDLKFSLSGLKEKGLSKFLEDINLAVQTAGSETGIARMFGRVQGMSAVLSLTGAQAKKFTEIMEQMRNKAGSTGDAVSKMMATARMDMKRYEASVKVMRIAYGKALAPLLDIIRKVKQAFVNFFTAIAKNAPWLVRLVGGLVLVGAAIAIVVAKIFALKAVFMLLLVFGKALVAGLMSAFAALAPVILPVGAAIAGIIAILYVLKRAYDENWSGFADWVKKVGQLLYHFGAALKQLFTTGEIRGATAEFLMMHDRVRALVQAIWYLVAAFKWLIGGMIKGFMAVGDVFAPIKGQFRIISQMFSRLGRIFKDAFGELAIFEDSISGPLKIIGAIGVAIGYVIGFVVRAFMAVLGVVITGLSAAVGALVAAFEFLVDFIKGFLRIFTGDWKRGLAQMVTAVGKFIVAVLSLLASLLDSILYGIVSIFGFSRETWEAFLSDLGDFFKKLGQWIVDAFVAVYQGIVYALEKIGAFFGWIVSGMRAAWNSFTGFFATLWDYVTSGIIKAIGSIGTAFKAVGDFLKSIWTPIFKWFTDKIEWIKNAADSLKNIASDIGDFFSDMGESIGNAVSDASSSLFGSKSSSNGGSSAFSNTMDAMRAKYLALADTTTPTAATVPSSQGLATEKREPQVIQVVNQPAKAVINLDGRVLAEAVLAHAEDKKEEKMHPVLPVWTGFGGR